MFPFLHSFVIMGSLGSATILSRALESNTLQGYLAHGALFTDDTIGLPAANGHGYHSPQWILNMAQRAVRQFQEQGVPLRTTKQDSRVIAIRMATSIECVVSFIAVLLMGHTVFPVATNVSEDILDHILLDSKSGFIISSEFHTMGPYKRLPLPIIEELEAYDMNDYVIPDVTSLLDEHEDALILHSSGTTGQPKLIGKTHRTLMVGLRSLPPFWQKQTLLTSSWMYWLGGASLLLFAMTRSVYKTRWTQQDDESDSEEIRVQRAQQMLIEVQPQLIITSASFLLPAVQTSESLDVLARCELVCNVGGVLPPCVATKLTSHKVNLTTAFGMTEMPIALWSAWENVGHPQYWDYIQALPVQKPHLAFRPLAQEQSYEAEKGGSTPCLYELVLFPSLPGLDPRRANDDQGCLHTGDIFIKRPDREDQFRCVGRMRDQIRYLANNVDSVLITTRPYEDVIERSHPQLIDAAMVVGDSRPRVAVLIFVKATVGDGMSDDSVKDAIWDTICEKLPEFLGFGLGKDTIIPVRNAKVPRTRKGDIVRPLALLKFGEVIDSVYSH